jgi:hypothetical protein
MAKRQPYGVTAPLRHTACKFYLILHTPHNTNQNIFAKSTGGGFATVAGVGEVVVAVVAGVVRAIVVVETFPGIWCV